MFLELFETRPIVEEAIQEVMLDDLRTNREQGQYTQMRKEISKIYGFDYDSLTTQVHKALEQGKETVEIERIAKEQLQKLIEQIREDRKDDLEQWSDLLKEFIEQNHATISQIRKSLEKFYGTEFQTKRFALKLAPHPQEKENLAIPSEKQLGEVTLYVPSIDTINPDVIQAAAENLIIDSFHELSHQQLQTKYFSELIESAKQTDEYKNVFNMYCEEQEPFYNFTKEAITNYIDAYIRQAQFHREQQLESTHSRDVYIMGSWINTELAGEYFDEGKPIDLEFVKRLFRLMQE